MFQPNSLHQSEQCLAHGAGSSQPNNPQNPALADVVQRLAACGIESAPQFCADLDPEVLLELERRTEALGLSGTTITVAAVQALHNRAKQLVLTMAWLGKAPELRFAQGSLSALASLLDDADQAVLVERDASLGGYQPLAGFEAAWAALPISVKNLTLPQVREFLSLHGVEPSTDAVAHSQLDATGGLEDSKLATVVDVNNEHGAARADLHDGASLHDATSDEPAIVAQGGAA